MDGLLAYSVGDALSHPSKTRRRLPASPQAASYTALQAEVAAPFPVHASRACGRHDFLSYYPSTVALSPPRVKPPNLLCLSPPIVVLQAPQFPFQMKLFVLNRICMEYPCTCSIGLWGFASRSSSMEKEMVFITKRNQLILKANQRVL